jgi:hypothetical protein
MSGNMKETGDNKPRLTELISLSEASELCGLSPDLYGVKTPSTPSG